MKLKQEARVLHNKAVSSLTTTMTAFNSPSEQGRATQVLLHLQHSFEMLLKASLVQNGVRVFDARVGRSIGFESCLEKCASHPLVKLTPAEAGTLRAIDAMRDDEQHWFNQVNEQLLYTYCRAGVTLFDELLERVFNERLATFLPTRVLPLSADPPKDISVLIDEEYKAIADLLSPGRRARHEARARIRTLLALEAHVEPETKVSDKDVNRVEKGIREGSARSEVFPRLADVGSEIEGAGITVTLHITKRDGAPVRYVADEDIPAAAIREVDLEKKYHWSASELAKKLKLTGPRATALRRHLGIDDNDDCRHVFVFGSQRITQYSDNAYRIMKSASETIDMKAVWAGHNPSTRPSLRTPCTVEGCAAGSD